MNFITKLKVQQWAQSSLQLAQLYRWDILKSNFIVSSLLNMRNLQLNILKKKATVFRFLIDCYTVLKSSSISLEELLLTLNSINPSTQFTMEYSKDQIPFLDILIKRNENSIWIDLYHKPTDTQRCLLFASSNPKHCKRNISFCLARTICTIAENNDDKIKAFGKRKIKFIKMKLPGFANKTRISENPLNATKRIMKT